MKSATDRDNFIAMLEKARMDFGYSEGDCIVVKDCKFRFFANGNLREIENNSVDADDDY